MRWWQAGLARLGVRTPTGRDTVAGAGLALLSLARLPIFVLLGRELPYPFWEIAVGYAFATADLATIAIRRRYPRAALAITTLLPLVSAMLPTRPPLIGIGLVVCVYTVAITLPRRQAAHLVGASMLVHIPGGIAIAALGGEVHGLVTFWGVRPGDWLGLAIAGSAAIGLAWLIGSYVRTRRAYAAAQADRVRRLEQEREERARTAVLEERAKIARELHDIAAHDLSAIIVQAGAADRLIDRDPAAARAVLRDLRAQGRDTLRALRGLVGIMREADASDATTNQRGPQPSLNHLEDLITRARAAGMAVDVRTTGHPRPLPAAVDLAAYRVIQEGLTNARKHAPDAPVHVSAVFDDQALTVAVRNELAGNPPAATGNDNGYGLQGMRERVQHAGGTLTFGPADSGGWTIDARFPVDPPPERNQP